MNDATISVTVRTRQEAHVIAAKLRAWFEREFPGRPFEATVKDVFETSCHITPISSGIKFTKPQRIACASEDNGIAMMGFSGQ